MALIANEARLRELLGEPSEQVRRKFHAQLNERARGFIARAPMLFLATADAQGRPVVSPKGDGPGFVRMPDAHTLLLPERKGNKLLLSLRNILVNPAVHLIFVVPNTGETLRVSGTATLDDDPVLCHELAERGQPALLVVRVQVASCFFHCAKAFLRSKLWQPEGWPAPASISFGAEIAEEGGLSSEAIAAFDAAVHGRYRTDL